MSHHRLYIITFVCLFIFSPKLWAQTQEDDKDKKLGSVYGVHVGPLLPNQIPGMTEIMPTWGVRYAFPVRKGLIELGAANARAKGVIYYNGSLSMRGDFSLDDLNGVAYAGFDTHYYAPPSSTFKMYFGAHAGGGFAMHLGDLLWFRTDMKFNVNPGTALYIGFGFEWRAPAGDTQEQEQQ